MAAYLSAVRKAHGRDKVRLEGTGRLQLTEQAQAKGGGEQPVLDPLILKKLSRANIVPHEAASGIVAEAEVLEVLDREQLDALIAYGQHRQVSHVTLARAFVH